MCWAAATCNGRQDRSLPSGNLTLEPCEVLFCQPQAGDYALLRLHAPQCARFAQPGTVVRLGNGQKDYDTPLMRADTAAGWVEILYQSAQVNPNEFITITTLPGPLFSPPYRTYPVLIADDPGTAPTVFLASTLRPQKSLRPLVLLGYATNPPFTVAPSRILVEGMPAGVIAAMPLMEDWRIASRIAHAQGRPGCFEGSVVELARVWLNGLPDVQRAEIEIYVSGSTAMTNAVLALVDQYQIPTQALALAACRT